MSSADEEWVKAAMSDDAVVVELLVRLHHEPPPPMLKRAPMPLQWSLRQRRSKSVSVNDNPMKPAHSQRRSPTTPLFWSGASAGVERSGSEECSRPTPLKLSSMSGSKIVVYSEKTNSKRSRKKTVAELQSEENSLVKERKDLKREMETLRLFLERQRARNRNLKRMKVEFQPPSSEESKPMYPALESTSGSQLQPEVAASRHIPTAMPPAVTASDIAQKSSTSETDAKFVLPDLNVPFGEPGCGVLWGNSR